MPGIVAATDLSSSAALAIDRAVALAFERSAKLTVLHVIDADLPGSAIDLLRTESESILRKQVGDARRRAGADAPLAVEVRIEVGKPYRLIAESLTDGEAEMLVVGKHLGGPVEDLFMSSTIERILRLTGTPVLVARHPANRPLARALVALDLSVPSRRAVEVASRLFPAARFELLHAYDIPFTTWMTSESTREHYRDQLRQTIRTEVDTFVATLDLGDRVTETVLSAGPPSQAILREAESRQSDLIVIGTHGRSGVGRAMLGSVAQEVLAGAKCDVLAVKGW